MKHTAYTEDALVEQPAIALLAELGWQPLNGMDEYLGRDAPAGRLYLGRETSAEVVLLARLRPALHKLNPALPAEALELAIEELTRDRSRLGLTHANREIYRLLKDGVLVTFRDEEGNDCAERVRLLDWDHPLENDFLLVSQLWVSGDIYKRRADLVGFVNGLPLLFIELKAAHKRLADAYNHNLKDYRDQSIPHLFWYNGLVVLSNGSATRLGSFGAPFEHFNEWKKINSEGEEGVISLETALRGTCTPARLLDLVENYTLFVEAEGGLKKLIAKYHQYLGVESAVQSVRLLPSPPGRGAGGEGRGEGGGKLGVFWHTQGSGKSYSMIFFAQKVLRKLPGNWTFVVVTDRKELDDQIYKNFADAGAVIEPQESVRAQSGNHLQTLLQEDHRYVFTLIHKFNTERGQVYPKLSDRSNIIVMTDEAHRSQYDQLALNMRNALPHAAFIGFTGTPLMAGEERTRQVFGDYVSIYNFKQSVDDNATVPLFYENRIPELQLTNPHLNRDMERLLEDAALDEAQESKLEREFAREYHLITRDDRLEKIAEDIVLHYMGLGYRGKAMVVAIDKATAVRMYDKVQKHWKMRLAELAADVESCDPLDKPDLTARLAFMQQTDMAVVVSQGQNEVAEMQAKGLDIRPHRERMVKEDLATRFKDADDPFRIVFVCAMWMTGFDVPSCGTIYLDKPMRNHTLMQTIARANRVFGEKVAGLIVDYIGIFRDLQRALAIYGSSTDGGTQPGETPVKEKDQLVAELETAIADCRAFMAAAGIDLDAIHAAEGFQRVKLLDDAEDALLVNDENKNQYLGLANNVDRLFHAILPDKAANRFGPDRKAIVVIADKIRSETPAADISGVMEAVEDLLDQSIAPKGYIIRPTAQTLHSVNEKPAHWLDLSQLDFDALRKHFENSRKHVEAEKLRGQVNAKLARLMRLNKTRADYAAQLQRLIDDYNAGRSNVDEFFAQLVSLAQNLNAEEKRGISEQLSEEELAVFDLLTRPDLKLSRKEQAQVKQVAKELLDTLKAERLVLDWRKRQQSRAAVQLTIEQVLDKLPEAFTPELYGEKCEAVYQHVYDSYYGAGKSLYD